MDFLNDEKEKSLLLYGVADEEKHFLLLQALNARGSLKELVYLIHITKDGMRDFFQWAGFNDVKVPKI